MVILILYLQDSYRKVDIITKEEFDSQRGIEDQRDDLGDLADSDLVFPLDLQEPVTKPAVPSSAPVKPPTEETKTQQREERSGERGRETSPSKGGSGRPKKGRWEKRARFYPVPLKQDSPAKVCLLATLCVYMYSMPFYSSDRKSVICSVLCRV